MIDIPAMSALFWMAMRHKREQDLALKQTRELLEMRCSQLREGLAGFKLEVARNYAAISELKDLEVRIVAHLLRIESKLDKTALKTEALSSKQMAIKE